MRKNYQRNRRISKDGDCIKVKGVVCIKALDADGKFLWEDTFDNLVVTLGKQSMAHLIAGDVANRHITQIQFGTSATAPALGDTAITGAFTKSIGTISYPASNEVLINWTLLTSEGNGMTIQEMGLRSANGNIFSRVLRGPIVKSSAFQLIGTWKFIF